MPPARGHLSGKRKRPAMSEEGWNLLKARKKSGASVRGASRVVSEKILEIRLASGASQVPIDV